MSKDTGGPALENVTKEGIEVKPGQVWRDLDKRMTYRHVKVLLVSAGRAVVHQCHSDGREFPQRIATKISVRRMHKMSTGWALVSDAS